MIYCLKYNFAAITKLRTFIAMSTTTKYISVKDVARYNGISPRAVHWHLQRGNHINGVKEYHKLAGGKTSAYLITPNENYLKNDTKRVL